MADVLKQIEFEVDGNRYVTSQLGAIEGRRLFLDLFKAVAPAIEAVAASGSLKSSADQESAMLSAAAAIIAQLDSTLLDALCAAFGPKTRHVVTEIQTPNLDPGYFNLHFAGRYVSLFKWVFECCKANGFLSFLPVS
jgi:hypothetical protein